MQKIVRKVYLSIMVIVLCSITLLTSTFAWIGLLNYGEFEHFDLNIVSSGSSNGYGLMMSLTGDNGTFVNEISATDIRRKILENMLPSSNVNTMTPEQIDIKYAEMSKKLVQCTVKPDGHKINDFQDLLGNPTLNYFKFDLYLAAYAYDDAIVDVSTTYCLDAYIQDGLFSGTIATRKLFRDYSYPLIPSDVYGSYKNMLTSNSLSGNISIDSSSAVRLAVQKYEKMYLYQPDNTKPLNSLTIYQGGTKYPSFDAKKQVYSLGGILEDNYNIAFKDYNSKSVDGYAKKDHVPEWAINRGDIEFRDNGIVNKIVDSTRDQVTVNDMVRLTFTFWVEGWDSDCFDIIDEMPVTLALKLSNVHYD